MTILKYWLTHNKFLDDINIKDVVIIKDDGMILSTNIFRWDIISSTKG